MTQEEEIVADTICTKAAEEIEKLRAEINEQARLLGISAEKELALLAKVEHLEMERDRLLKGEYICKRCGLRKDNEHLTHDF